MKVLAKREIVRNLPKLKNGERKRPTKAELAVMALPQRDIWKHK
jgi:hypothetical protein